MKKYFVQLEFVITQQFEVEAEDVDSAIDVALEHEGSLDYLQYDYFDYEWKATDIKEFKDGQYIEVDE